MAVVGRGRESGYLSGQEIADVAREGLGGLPIDGKRVLVLVPDGTRTMPMPLMFETLEREIGPRVAAFDILVALGTHSPMSDAQLTKLIGQTVENGRIGQRQVFNHRWEDPSTFVTLGTIPARDIERLSGGRLSQDVPVALNRLVTEYDHVIICGPVFPHEVAGFSGGTKYLFPGIAGAEIINFTHWLGALITNYEIIGTMDTPVRAVVDRAASLLQTPLSLMALVVTHDGTAGLYIGDVHEAWRKAATLSANRHIIWLNEPVDRVLSVMPKMYDDLWVAGKGMYKMEPAVRDGGEVIIYAPHVDEVSYTHGKLIDEVGYHCLPYFKAQWERFKHYPGGILAHSTHVKGRGSFEGGVETPRIKVTLATGIPKERADRINLGYQDPGGIDPARWQDENGQGALLVPRAGEYLYRVGRPPAL